MTVNTARTTEPRRLHDEPTAAGSVSEATTPPLTAADLVPETADLRFRAGRTHQHAIGLDRLVNEMSVRERAAQYEQLSTTSLLDALARQWGLSWTSIGRLVGVSVPAIRKWRHGEQSTPGNRAQLALVVALLNTLDFQFMIEDPASWLEIPLAGTQYALMDLVADGRVELVLDYAARRLELPERVLDRWMPTWREAYPDGFETFVDSEGHRGLRVR